MGLVDGESTGTGGSFEGDGSSTSIYQNRGWRFPKLTPNTIWSTPAGNHVYKILSPADRPLNEYGSVIPGTTWWSALVLLDTGSRYDDGPSKRMFGTNVVINNMNLVPFDALALGTLWEQVRQLSEEAQRTWKAT